MHLILHFTMVKTASVLQLSHLVFHSLDVGYVHVVGGGTNVFILLTSEDVDTDQVHLHEQRENTERINRVPKRNTHVMFVLFFKHLDLYFTNQYLYYIQCVNKCLAYLRSFQKKGGCPSIVLSSVSCLKPFFKEETCDPPGTRSCCCGD